MPHVIVKLWPGKSEPQNNRLAEEIAKNIEEAKSQGWAESADNRHSRQAKVPQKTGPITAAGMTKEVILRTGRRSDQTPLRPSLPGEVPGQRVSRPDDWGAPALQQSGSCRASPTHDHR